MRRRLQTGWFSEFRGYADPLEDDPVEAGRPVRLDWWVRNFICADCNGTWAKDLEEDAGNELYNFVHGAGRISDPPMRFWAWFFAMKLWRYYHRNETMFDGVLHPVLDPISRRDMTLIPPIRLCQLPTKAGDSRWRFGWLQGGPPRYWSFVLWGTAWFVIQPPRRGALPNLPFDNVLLESGLRRLDLPVVPRPVLSQFWASTIRDREKASRPQAQEP
jgi:hypothetical protein